VDRVLVLEGARTYAARQADLDRALHLGWLLSACAAVLTALVAGGWAAAERRQRDLATRAARGAAVAQLAATVATRCGTRWASSVGTVELMVERGRGRLTERDGEALEDILGEVARLRRLTDDFLDLSSDRPLAGVDLEVASFLDEAARAGRAATGLAIEVEAPSGLHVQGDGGRLRQVFLNLVANAARAGAQRVRFRAAAEGARIRLQISDDGPGIPEEIRPRLFEPFATTREDGNGLGLAVSRRIVERHGGSLALLAAGRGNLSHRAAARRGERLMGDILVVDDEPKLGKLVAEMLELDGHHVQRVGSGKDALSAMATFAMDVVVTDLRMPEVDGLAVLASAVRQSDPPDVMLMTGHASTQSAVEAMKRGAADYLSKPFSMDELRVRVKRLCEQRALRRRSSALVERLTPSLIGDSPAMAATLEAAMRVAPTPTTVLLLGESGTGKSQIARRIHYASGVSTGPLVEVHCAALPEALLESELFGHEKGAFTGAQLRRLGHLAAAEGGTLFLDEIGEITAATQLKLLRFLQDRVYVPLGSTTERTANVRVIAATNRDLKAAVGGGTFREDLYYRLNVFSIVVPPLRERQQDVLPLAIRFLASRGVPEERLSAGARGRLELHTGRGTSASWRTCSSARSSSPARRPSARAPDLGGGSSQPERRLRAAGARLRPGRLRARAAPGGDGARGREQERRRPPPGHHPAEALLAPGQPRRAGRGRQRGLRRSGHPARPSSSSLHRASRCSERGPEAVTTRARAVEGGLLDHDAQGVGRRGAGHPIHPLDQRGPGPVAQLVKPGAVEIGGPGEPVTGPRG
jgi:DNA-binding NtrC family response regulator